MKKSILLFMTCVLLAGCTDTRIIEDTTAELTESEPESVESTAQSYSAEETESDSEEESSAEEPLAPANWQVEPMTDGRMRIVFPEEITEVDGSFFYANKVYLSAVYGEKKGLVLLTSQKETPDQFYPIGQGRFQRIDDASFLYKGYTGTIYYVKYGEEPVPVEMKSSIDSNNFGEAGYFLRDRSDKENISYYTMEGQKRFDFHLGRFNNFQAITVRENKVYGRLACDEGNYLLILDIRSGELEKKISIGTDDLSCMAGELLAGISGSTDRIVVYDTAGNPVNAFPFVSDNASILAARDDLLVASSGLYTVLYDTEGTAYYAETTSDSTHYLAGCQFVDDCLYLSYEYFSEELSGNVIVPVKLQELSEIHAKEELQLADYPEGITILSGENAITVTSGYVMEAVTDPERNAQAVELIQETLAQFPKGFFEEMLGERSHYHSLVISFVDSIVGNGENTLESAGGVVNDQGNILWMWISDLSVDQPDTLFHEMMHVIERVMSSWDIYFDDWDAYTPEGFEFTYTYEGEDDFTYTPVSEEEVWFPTPYCKTYPTEDRAMLFGLMATQNEYYTQFPHIRERMDYLARMLRQAFTCLQDADSILWER